MQFTIYSRTSIEILDLLDNLEIDAGITYLDNEPLGRVSTRAALSTSATGCSPRPMRRSATATASPGRRSRRCRFAC